MRIICPYCNADLSPDDVHPANDEGWIFGTYECPKCGEEMEIETDPVYFVEKARGEF